MLYKRAKKELSTLDGILAAIVTFSVPFICAYIAYGNA